MMDADFYGVEGFLVVRLDDGEKIVEGVKKACRDNGIDGGVIVSLAGAVVDPVVINPGGSDDKPEPVTTQLSGKMEVVGNGNIAVDEGGELIVHLHVSLGENPENAHTCHLVSAQVKYFVEVVIAKLDKKLVRRGKEGWEFKVLTP